MGNKKTTKKAKPKNTAPKKAKANAKAKKGPQVYICNKVAGWVRYRGKRYSKGGIVMVHPDKMTPEDLVRLQRNFEPRPIEIMTGTSEPVELLDEGDDHVSNSN